MPASFYRAASGDERAALAVRNGSYCLPTIELINWLRTRIAGRSAIEIGAGNGVIAEALGIMATDNFMQNRPEIAAHYALIRQPTVRYGKMVENIPADDAVRRYRPSVVVAAWVTHRYSDDRPDAYGNPFGVDEEKIIACCDEYIFIGNERVHAGKSIWDLPHEIHRPDWLFGRSLSPGGDFIGIWRRG